MGHREISRLGDSLDAVLRDVLRLREGEAERISEAVKELAAAVADNEIDRLMNRGDYRS